MIDRRQFPNVVTDTDRHGNLRHYYRVKGRRKERISAAPESVDWHGAYLDARARSEGEQRPVRPRPKAPRAAPIESLSWFLRTHYFQSPNWLRDLKGSTRDMRERALERLCATMVDGFPLGERPFALLRKRHIVQLRNDLQGKPGAANLLVLSLRQALDYAVELEFLDDNPADGVRKLKSANPDGHYTWTPQDIDDFIATHPLGTTAYLGVMLPAMTGARRGDIVRLGPAMELDAISEDGRRMRAIHFRPEKTDDGTPGSLSVTVEILPLLAAAIAGCPNDGLTYLVSKWGRPFHRGAYGNAMRAWCDQAADKSGNANLRRATPHGLRKAGATLAAESGATTHQLMAIFGWKTAQMAELYTRKFDRRRVSLGAVHFLGKR